MQILYWGFFCCWKINFPSIFYFKNNVAVWCLCVCVCVYSGCTHKVIATLYVALILYGAVVVCHLDSKRLHCYYYIFRFHIASYNIGAFIYILYHFCFSSSCILCLVVYRNVMYNQHTYIPNKYSNSNVFVVLT